MSELHKIAGKQIEGIGFKETQVEIEEFGLFLKPSSKAFSEASSKLFSKTFRDL